MMVVEKLDDIGTYRCELGEFAPLSDDLPAGPPPPTFGSSHWTRDDPRLHRRRVGDQEFVDLIHEARPGRRDYCTFKSPFVVSPRERR